MSTELDPADLVGASTKVLAMAQRRGRVRGNTIEAALASLDPGRPRSSSEDTWTDSPPPDSLVVADLSADEVDRAYRAMLADGGRELSDLIRYVPPPDAWLEPIVDHLTGRHAIHVSLARLDPHLARYVAVEPDISATLYLRLLAGPALPVLTVVTYCPLWMRELFTPAEVTQLVRALAEATA